MSAVQGEALTPFLKWAGGKRWFVERWLHLIPEGFDRYIEPFIGSGAVYFALRPERAILADLNADLVATYRAIRDHPKSVSEELARHHANHCAEHYYRTRSDKPNDPIIMAAWLIYLNRTCWNGLYRVNKRNEFNVPIGTKNQVILSTDNFERIGFTLSSADIECLDFGETISRAGDGDFVFVDPPYTVKHNLNGFLKYNDTIFSWSDQVRLKECVELAVNRGAKVLVTNANHESIKDLYKGIGRQTVVERSSVLAASSNFRTKVEELVVQSWR